MLAIFKIFLLKTKSFNYQFNNNNNNNNKARYQPKSAMRVVHRIRKEKKISCLKKKKNIHSDAINKNTNK